jgi:hypothetical protein
MIRRRLQSAAFVRGARRLVKKHPQVGPTLAATLAAFMADNCHAGLKRHKLSGPEYHTLTVDVLSFKKLNLRN